RPIGNLSVFVAITTPELTQRDDVRVLQLGTRRLPPLFPVDLRLANAILEPKWFMFVEIAGTKRGHLLECITPGGTFGALDKESKLFRFPKKHYHGMRLAPVAPPSPV